MGMDNYDRYEELGYLEILKLWDVGELFHNTDPLARKF
jgi:hypothetical protein